MSQEARCRCPLIPAPLRSRPLVALLVAEAVSVARVADDVPGAAVVRARRRPGSPTRMGIVLAASSSGRAPRHPQRQRDRPLRRAPDDAVADLARAPLIAAIPLLHALGLLDFSLLLVLVALVGVFIAPYFVVPADRAPRARRRGRDRRRAGERRGRGRPRGHEPARAGRRRAPDLGVRGAERPLRRRGHRSLFSFVVLCALRARSGRRSRGPTRAAACSPGSASSAATSRARACSGSPRCSSTCSRRCSSPRSRCSPTRSSTPAPGSPARSSRRSGSAPSSARVRRGAARADGSTRSASAPSRSSR